MDRPPPDDGLSDLGIIGDVEFPARWLRYYAGSPPDRATAERLCNDFLRDYTKRYPYPVCTNADTLTEGTRSPDSPPEHTECPICLDTYGSEPGGEHALQVTGIANCRHVFGSMCLKTILMTNPGREKKCPLCRAKWVAATYTGRFRFDTTHLGLSRERAGRPQTNRHDVLGAPSSRTLPSDVMIPEDVRRLLEDSERVRERAIENLRRATENLSDNARRALLGRAHNPVGSQAPAAGDTSAPSFAQRVEDLLRSVPANTNGLSRPMPASLTTAEFRQTMEQRMETLRSTGPAPTAEQIERTNETPADAPPDENEVPSSNDLLIDLTGDTPPRSAPSVQVIDTDMEETDESIVENMRALEEIRDRARATGDRARQTNRRARIVVRLPNLPQNSGVQRPNSQNNRPMRAVLEDHIEELVRASEAGRQTQRNEHLRRQVLDDLPRSPRRSNRGPRPRPPTVQSSERPFTTAERTRRRDTAAPEESVPSVVGLLEREYRVTQRELACDQREARLRRQEERINRFMETARRHNRELLDAELQLVAGDTISEGNNSWDVLSNIL